MGAAMAPAAYDTLCALFRDTRTKPEDYDLIVTGDLGRLGHQIVSDFFAGVRGVLSMRICPMAQRMPPQRKAFR